MLPNNIYQIILSNVLMHIDLCPKNKSKLGIGIVLHFLRNLITYLMSHFVVPGTKILSRFPFPWEEFPWFEHLETNRMQVS